MFARREYTHIVKKKISGTAHCTKENDHTQLRIYQTHICYTLYVRVSTAQQLFRKKHVTFC